MHHYAYILLGVFVAVVGLYAVIAFLIAAPVGTRSLLIGVHQFLWHPLTVWLAWVRFYGEFPTWRECVCIFIHDWGYWGCPEMDGPKGSEHTRLGADIANRLFGIKYYSLCVWHSRHYAETYGREPSKLCWPDKVSMLYEPEWFYLLRARLSGEIHEYRKNAIGHLPLSASDREWLRWLRTRLHRLAEQEGAKFRAAKPKYEPTGAPFDEPLDLPRSTFQTNAARSGSLGRLGTEHTHPEVR